MGSKKRESGVEEVEDKQQLNFALGNGGAEPSKKRIKKEKKRKDIEIPESENVNDTNTASTSLSAHKAFMNSMERRKLRKLADKERTKAETKKIMEVEPKNDGNESASTSNTNSGGGVLPEFHISVFKDLGAVDASKREAAAKALVTDLIKVQSAYDKLENKDEVEDKSKLEAEKDDGLDNCAPSLRYVVRRLIRGVSSSREELQEMLDIWSSRGLPIPNSRVFSQELKTNVSLATKQFTLPKRLQ